MSFVQENECGKFRGLYENKNLGKIRFVNKHLENNYHSIKGFIMHCVSYEKILCLFIKFPYFEASKKLQERALAFF